MNLFYSKDDIEVGIDEVGRGCLSGPVYAAAVIMPKKFKDDDEFYKQKVSKCVDVFIRDSGSVGVVYGDYDTYNTSTGIKIREFKEPFNRRRLIDECIVHSGSVVSKEALLETKEETGYYDENMRTCEDYDLWMRISESFMIVHIAEAMTLVRVTGSNSSFIIDSEVWQQNWRRVMEKFHQRNNAI